MQTFLKRTGIALGVVVLITLLFWQTLTTTAFWVLVILETWGTPAVQVTTGPTIDLPTPTGTASSTIVGSLTIPHQFQDTQVLHETPTILVFSDRSSNDRFLVADMANFTSHLLSGQDQAQQQLLCDTLQTLSTSNVCASNQEFLAAIMQVSPSDAGLFSSNYKKSAVASLLLFKQQYLPKHTTAIGALMTDTVTGHVAYGPQLSIAFVFDKHQTGYEITFVNMDKSIIDAVLTNIGLSTTADQS